jgi:predicted nucleic acid-binding protein
VVEEDGTVEALALLKRAKLSAPDFLLAECANALWKKVRKNEFTRGEALVAARLLESSEVELVSTRALVQAATRIAIELNHPAYDCLYLALALAHHTDFATADDRFVRIVRQARSASFRRFVISLSDAAAKL